MRRILNIAAYTILLMVVACSDEVYTDMISNVPRTMSVWYNSEVTPGSTTISVDPSEQTATFHVKSLNTGWAITSSADWIKLSATEGNVDKDIVVNISANPSFVNSRVAVLKFRSTEGDYPVERDITISQSAITPYLSVSDNIVAFDAKAQSATLTVDTNLDLSCVSNQTWATAKREGTNLSISVPENTGAARTATVSLQADLDGTVKTFATVEVKQAAANVAVGDKIKFGPDAETAKTSVTSEVSWSISMASDVAAWLTVTPMAGNAGSHELTAKAAANNTDGARTGTIDIIIGGVTKTTIPVEQVAHQIDLSTSSVTVDYQGGTKVITITSNCRWTAECSEWLTIDVTQGEAGSTIMSATMPSYDGDAGRPGEIAIKTIDGAKVLATIAVTQTGYNYVDIDCNSTLADSRPRTISVDLTSNTDWTATTNAKDGWLKLASTSGRGNAKLQIEVADNPHVSPRTADVYFKAGYDEKTISFTQPGRTLQLSTSELVFGNTGGSSQTVIATTDGAIAAVSSEDWATVTVSGNTITVEAAPNSGVDERQCKVTVSLTDLAEGETLERTIEVRQEGYVIETSPSVLQYAPDGGEYELQIVANVAWRAEVTPKDGWLTLSRSTGDVGASVITVKAAAATSESTRDATIEFYTQSGNVKIDAATTTATQSKPYLTISGNGSLANSRACDIEIAVDCNTSWTATKDADASWVTLSTVQGKGVGVIQATVADNPSANERPATITVKTDAVTRTLSVKQPGRKLTVSAASLTFSKEGGTSELITVSAEGGYSITTSYGGSSTGGWLTVNQTGNSFTTTATEYAEEDSRSCEIIVALTGLPAGESKQCVISVRQDGEALKGEAINGYEYVDLGLPSGLLWATCNVGASSPEDYGSYFAWGETAPKSDYSTGTSTTYNKTITELKSAGVIDSNGNLTDDYDAATKNWGAPWRMPTYEECKELVDKCTTEWTTQGGVNGRKVTGPNGNSIFLPAVGYCSGSSLINSGSSGYYWHSTVYYTSSDAYNFYFNSSNFSTYNFNRYYGQSVRPVSNGERKNTIIVDGFGDDENWNP